MIPNLSNPHDSLTAAELGTFKRFLVKENALTSEECDELVSYGADKVVPAANKHDKAFLISVDHHFLPLNHTLHLKLEKLWEEAIDFFKFDVTFIEPYELKRYPTGGFFSRHIDNYHGLNLQVDRKISMSIQLTDPSEYDGGDLVLSYIKLPKEKGTMIFFPSFYPHHVEKITRGNRWSVISWAWGPYWK
jgi:hypothetical protein